MYESSTISNYEERIQIVCVILIKRPSRQYNMQGQNFQIKAGYNKKCMNHRYKLAIMRKESKLYDCVVLIKRSSREYTLCRGRIFK